MESRGNCILCGKPIYYGEKYVNDSGNLYHLSCYLKLKEKFDATRLEEKAKLEKIKEEEKAKLKIIEKEKEAEQEKLYEVFKASIEKPNLETKTLKEETEEEEKAVEEEKQKSLIPPTKEVIDPQIQTKEEGDKKIFMISLPDIKSENEIEIKELYKSIEIKARVGDKVYFQIIPTQGKILSKKFENSTLTLELEKE